MPMGQMTAVTTPQSRKIDRVRRKRARRYQRRYSSFVKLPRFSSQGLPKSIVTKLNYVTNFALSSTTGTPSTIGSYIFRLNSMAYPNFTGGGTAQPYMHDTYASLYARYVVYGCKIKLLASTDSSAASFITMRPALTSTAVGNINLEGERGATKRLITIDSPVVLKRYVPIHKLWGVKKSQVLFDDTFQALSGGSPTKISYLQIGYQSNDALSSTSADCRIFLKFYIKWFNFNDQNAS